MIEYESKEHYQGFSIKDLNTIYENTGRRIVVRDGYCVGFMKDE